MRLEGKVCVITGAGGGMGREAALAFCEEGAFVCAADVSLEAVEETLVASLLTRSLLEERAGAYRTNRERFGQLPRTLVALEEAQRVLTRLDDAEFNVFPRLARERRLFGCPIPQGAYWRAIDTAKDLTEAAKELAALGR